MTTPVNPSGVMGIELQQRESIPPGCGVVGWQWAIYEGLIGLDQPRISNLERGHLDRFSVQKLIRVLALLNRRVDVKVVAVGAIPKVAELKLARKRNKQRSGGM